MAERAAKDRRVALSLQATPLTNVSGLKRLGLVAELDWRTRFDRCYRLKPDEWNKKWAGAIEQQKQENLSFRVYIIKERSVSA